MKRVIGVSLALLVGCGSPAKPTPEVAKPAPPGESPPAPPVADSESGEDKLQWLEEVEGQRPLDWAREQNKKSEGGLEATLGFAKAEERIRTILDAKDKIPLATKYGKYLYNFWQDGEHRRGLWRRTSFAEYVKQEPTWEVLIDVDALNKQESASWVWGGAECLYPKYDRCLVTLSRGGGDSHVIREYDTVKKQFVDKGFELPEAKSSVSWKDMNTVYVGTDFGAGSLTTSGYPRITKEWKRGTPLAEAKQIFEGKETDVAAGGERQWDHNRSHDIFVRRVSFFETEDYLWDGKTATKIDKPDDIRVQFWDDQMLFRLRKPWTIGSTTWPAGSLLAISEKDYLTGERAFTPLFTPSATSSLKNYAVTKTKVYVSQLDDVKDGIVEWTRTGAGKARKWTSKKLEVAPGVTTNVRAWDDDENDDYWLSENGYLTPATVSLVQKGKKLELKHSPARFNADGLEVTQHFVTSKDGTRVPYFLVAKKNLPTDGSTPTLIEGYGGFEIPLLPGYNPFVGASWLERGGAYVVPNLRGGGEYGPAWHDAATKHNRQRVYEDFAAIAEDLIKTKVTRPDRLGIKGGSNGGLLVGVMMTERPDLFGAVVCSAPLLDMKRFHKLLAGASWMAEYGDPDNAEDWSFIAKYSPYQNVRKGTKYPPVLFTTSTRDDRVHPGHARKMAAKMIEQGHDVLFYENIEGGHGGAADSAQAAHLVALEYAFLWQHLGIKPVQ